MPGWKETNRYGPAPTGAFLNVVTHLLDVLLGDDPRGARLGRAEEGHEVRPGLLEAEADAVLIDDLDGRHARLHERRPGALVAVEGELHVLGRDRIAVVKLDARPQDELVDQPVR